MLSATHVYETYANVNILLNLFDFFQIFSAFKFLFLLLLAPSGSRRNFERFIPVFLCVNVSVALPWLSGQGTAAFRAAFNRSKYMVESILAVTADGDYSLHITHVY